MSKNTLKILQFPFTGFLVCLVFMVQAARSQDYWQPTNGPDHNIYPGHAVMALTIDHNGYIYAVTEQSLVYRSTDNGNSWIKIMNGLPLGWSISLFSDALLVATPVNQNPCFKIHEKNYIFFAIPQKGLFRTEDCGENWIRLENGFTSQNPNSIRVFSMEGGCTFRYILVGTGKGVFMSSEYFDTELGEKWTLITEGNIGLTCLATKCNKSRPGRDIWAGTYERGIFVCHNITTDQPAKWQNVWFDPLPDKRNGIIVTDRIYSLQANGRGDVFAGLNAPPMLRRTIFDDNWKELSFIWSQGRGFYSIVINEKDHIFCSAYFCVPIFRSFDNGDTWSRIDLPEKWLYTRPSVVVLAIGPGGFLYAGADNGLVYRSKISTLAPVVTTLDATEVTENSAIINAEFNLGIEERTPSLKFEYGSYNYGYEIVPKTLGFDHRLPFSRSLRSQNVQAYAQLTNLQSSTIYCYRIVASNQFGTVFGEEKRFKTLRVTTDVTSSMQASHKYALGQNYPNPFNPETTLNYEVPKEGTVSINIYNSLGKLVRELVNKDVIPGKYSVRWNGKDDDFQDVPNGCYFIRMQAGTFVATQKAVLIR